MPHTAPQKLPGHALQTAIYARLAADFLAAGAAYTVYDNVPDDLSYPYVSISGITDLDFHTKDHYGSDSTVTLHAWSNYAGWQEVTDILDATLQSLRDGSRIDTFLVAGWHVWDVQKAAPTRVYHEEETNVRHGVLEIRLRLTQA